MKASGRAFMPALILALFASSLSSCNFFDPFDSPTSDTQLQSAGRACLDKGDFACAKDMYAKMSADSGDVAASESAYAILDEQGASMATFMSSIGNGGGGFSGFTSLAETLSKGAGRNMRAALFSAYQKIGSIKDPSLQGLVQFLTASALAAEMLGEAAGTDGVLSKTEILKSTACASATCAADPNCDGPSSGSGAALTDGTLNSASDSLSNSANTVATATNATMAMVYDAINQAFAGLKAARGTANGGSGFGGIQDALNAIQGKGGNGVRCVRSELVAQGLGR